MNENMNRILRRIAKVLGDAFSALVPGIWLTYTVDARKFGDFLCAGRLDARI